MEPASRHPLAAPEVRGTLAIALQSLLLWAACAIAVFLVLQRRGDLLADIDSLYHYQVAALIREHPPWVDISWLPFTVLHEHGPDHHWGFHLLLAPLTALGHDQGALNLVSAIVAGAVPAAIFPLLKRARMPFALAFAVLLIFSSDALPFRVAGLRAQALALVFMVAALFAMTAGRHVLLGLIAFLFTESYHGAMILALLGAATLAAQWVATRRADLRIVVAVAVGVFAGLILSPWFPDDIGYLIFHTVFKTGSHDPFLVGTEWLKPPLSLLIGGTLVAHALLAGGLFAYGSARARGARGLPGADTLAFGGVTVVFLAMNAMSWRFVEYYAPFAVITSGLLMRDAAGAWPDPRRFRIAAVSLLAAALAWGVPHGLTTIDKGAGERFDAFRDFMAHVDANDPAPFVFNTFWSDFQHMVFWSPRARYAAGLDGNYLRFGDPARFRLWYDFSSGKRLDRHDNAQAIAKTFGAGWIVVSSYQGQLADNLAQDPGAELAMARPGSGWLFRIKPP